MNETAPVPTIDLAATSRLAREVLDEVNRAIVGKRDALTLVLCGVLAGGHVLLEDLPGLGKTLAARSFAQALGLRFTRAQFTPDLLPADLTGSFVFDQRTSEFVFRQGPLFTGLLLADEINRTPPKTQAALLEAMEERQVSADGITRLLPEPFVVIATQNPVEYEGTYPLPEAQLDRFLFKLLVGYPSEAQEREVLARHHRGLDPHDVRGAGVRAVATRAHLDAARAEVSAVTVDDAVLAYVVALARATRASGSLSLGVSPRGAAMLLHAAKAWAWLSGRGFVTPDEVKAVAKPCLRHRVIVKPELELEGASSDTVLDGILAAVPTPR